MKTGPYEQIEALYEKTKKQGDLDFYYWLELHMRHGFVYSTPDFFVMAKAVNRGAWAGDVGDARMIFEQKDCDCWFISALAGNVLKAWEVLPRPYVWFAFARGARCSDGPIKFYPTDRLKKLTRAMCSVSKGYE